MPQPQLGEVIAVIGSQITNTFPWHVHESYCLGIIDQGARQIVTRDTEIVIPAGHLFVIQPGISHCCGPATEAGHSYRVIALSPALLESITGEVPYFGVRRIGEEWLIRLFEAVFVTLQQPSSLLEQQSRLFDLLAGLMPLGSGELARIKTGEAVRQAQAIMRAQYAERLTLDDLAAAGGLSPYHFQRVFTHETGLSPHDYLEQVRIEKAQEMLDKGGSLAETALMVGFVDQSHFTRTFKRLVGIPPGKYTRLHSPVRG